MSQKMHHVLQIGAFLFTVLLAACGVPLASPEMDLAAKQLQPDTETALIYVYRTWAFRAGGVSMPVSVNGTKVGDLNTGSYLYFRSYPGDITVDAWASANLNVQAGSAYFIKFYMYTYGGDHIEPVSEPEGRSAVASMNLVSMPSVALIDTDAHRTQVALAEAEAARLAAVNSALGRKLAQCEAKRSAPCFRSVLSDCADCILRQQALAGLAAAVGKGRNPLAGYRTFVKDHPDGMEHVPPKYRIYFVGPEGMTVYDLLQSRKKGMSSKRIAERIRTSESVYRDFSPEEVSLLRKKGLTGEIITAMRESTAKAAEKAAPQAAAPATVQEGPQAPSAAELAQYEGQLQEAVAACHAACDQQRQECLEQVRKAKLNSGGSTLERLFNLASNVTTAANCIDAVQCKANCGP